MLEERMSAFVTSPQANIEKREFQHVFRFYKLYLLTNYPKLLIINLCKFPLDFFVMFQKGEFLLCWL